MKTILVIDDNTDIRENTAEILTLAGYTTITAENGKQGVAKALEIKPDLIVCDIMMPELDGYGVLHLLRKNTATETIPFVFITAKAERSDFRKGMEMGADDYITKPFDDLELLKAIEIRLKKSELLNNNYPTTSSDIINFISDMDNAGLLKNLTAEYSAQTFTKKQVLYQEGQRPRYLFLLTKGKVKAVKNHEDGKDYITDFYSEGSFIGYTALLEDKNYEDNAIVVEDAEALLIPKADFLQLIHSNTEVAMKFIRIVTQNIKEKEERMLQLAYSSLRKRVANALIDLQSKFDSENKNPQLAISREDFANYIGTATESLIRTLSDFKSEKLIEIQGGKIIVTNPVKLQLMVN